MKDPDKIVHLEHGLRGKPKKLGDLDKKVQKYIHKLRSAGTPVNCSIVMLGCCSTPQSITAAARAWRNLELGRRWAESLMSHMGLVHCKTTKQQERNQVKS